MELVYDLDLVVVQSLVHHQVLGAQCEDAHHILKLDAVHDELLKLLVPEVVATRLLTLVEVDFADWCLAVSTKVDLDYLFEPLDRVDVAERSDLLLQHRIVVDGVVLRLAAAHLEDGLEVPLHLDFRFLVIVLATTKHLISLTPVLHSLVQEGDG